MGRSVMQEAVTLEEAAASSYWTEAEARVVLEAYEASGLSQAEFARRHGLSVLAAGVRSRGGTWGPLGPLPRHSLPHAMHRVDLASLNGSAPTEIYKGRLICMCPFVNTSSFFD
jgi:hypothetical protein